MVVNDWNEQFPGRDPCINNLGFGAWGNYVMIRHDNTPDRDMFYGSSFSVYAHLYSIEDNVQATGTVLRGTLLGYQGSTGNSSNPHLHFQMDRDKGNSTYQHPYSFGDADLGDIADVAEYTFNPMPFVQAQIVSTTLSGPGACYQYFPGITPGAPACEDYEPEIDHEWFTGGPPGYSTNTFSGRWEGTIQIPPGQTWIFYVTASDGVRLWVNSNLIVDQWHTQEPPTTYTTLAPIGPGSHQVKVEYYEDTGDAVIQLAWQKALDTFLPVVLHEATPTPTITPTPTRTITPTPCPYPPGDPRCTG